MVFLKKGYETFVRNLEELEEGKEREMEIRDIATYRIKVVKAQLYSPDSSATKTEAIWVRALVGHLLDEKPWKIKVNKVIEER